MRFLALATDYDGTIAHHGKVDAATRDALAAVRASGRRLVLVTGRELPDLEKVLAGSEMTMADFDAVVAENGAVIHRPALKQTRLLGEPPPPAFAAALHAAGVAPISVGQVIVATWQPHEAVVLETIRRLGLELQVIFNKGAVMVLPSGINKAVGLRAALDELGLSRHNAVGVGDAENDHAFLSECECAVAVGNALPALKDRADLVTEGPHGQGVQELIAQMIGSDLAAVGHRLTRHSIEVGESLTEPKRSVRLPPYGGPVLLAGTSGGGKSTLATALLEQLTEQGYQFCIIDPEGDYAELPGVTALGDAQHIPTATEILERLATPAQSAAVNLLGVPMADRAPFLESLLPHLQEMRARLGRPHWLVIDEAHHVLPTGRHGVLALPTTLSNILLITVHPDHVAPALLEQVGAVLVIGAAPQETLASFAAGAGSNPPPVPREPLPPGEALVWFRARGAEPSTVVRVRSRTPTAERRRHLRKYAAGELGPDKSFYFRGPEGQLNLRVQNLQLFLQVADGVDDGTWLFHLRQGDYSRWFNEAIKDPELAADAQAVEKAGDLDAATSRARIRAAIEKRYTAAA